MKVESNSALERRTEPATQRPGPARLALALRWALVFALSAGCNPTPEPQASAGDPASAPANSAASTPEPRIEGTEPGEIRFLALGDSYTIGESVAVEQRWPVQLAALLRARGLDVAEPEIIATTGWTTDELQDGIAQKSPSPPYELVSLLIGVNNQYRGRAVNEYEDQLAELLGQAIEFAGDRPERVLVLSIPDWGVTPFATARGRDPAKIAREIDRFNATKKEKAAAAGVRWVDVTPISRQATAEPALVAEDGLHPSGSMYTEWARLALAEALQAVGAEALELQESQESQESRETGDAIAAGG